MPSIWMDVDVALAEVPVNILPLIDDSDFKSRETGIVYDQAGMDLVWNFVTTAGAFTQTAVTPTTGGVHDWAHQGDGMYTIEIPDSGGTIDNDTEGFGWFTGFCTGILPWRGPVIGFRAAGLNNKLIDASYTVTRGLSGTALPNAVADAAGGLPISDAGELDLDALNTAAVRLSAARAQVLDDWINAGRLDLLLDAIKTVADNLPESGALTTIGTDTARLTAARAAILTDWIDGGRLDLLIDALATAAALAAHDGKLDTAQTDLDNPAQYRADVSALATAANQTTILNRIGAITGAGVNTILGFFKALLNKAASTPSDIGGTFTPAADSTEAISEAVATIDVSAVADQVWDEASGDHQSAGSTGKALTDAQAAGDPWASALPGAYGAGTAGSIIGNLIASTWSNVTRTLTQTAAEIQAVLEGSRIAIHRGDDLSVSLTGLGSLASRTHLWFTVKRDKSDVDTAAIIQITEGEGLTRLNGAEGTVGNGSLTVDDEDAGNITIVLKAVETAKLRRANLHYDIQVLISGVISTRTESRCNIAVDVTRATSG